MENRIGLDSAGQRKRYLVSEGKLRRAGIPRSLIQQGGWHHQEGHCRRSRRSRPWHCFGAAREGRTATPGAAGAKGGFSRIATTRPAQTPVAWSTFATGTNPGAHGIFDFLRRDPKTYLPDFGLNRYEQKNAFVPPKAVNLRRATPVWDLLKSAGISSAVSAVSLHVPTGLDARAHAIRDGRSGLERRAGNGHVLYHERDGQTARERERCSDRAAERMGCSAPT